MSWNALAFNNVNNCCSVSTHYLLFHVCFPVHKTTWYVALKCSLLNYPGNRCAYIAWQKELSTSYELLSGPSAVSLVISITLLVIALQYCYLSGMYTKSAWTNQYCITTDLFRNTYFSHDEMQHIHGKIKCTTNDNRHAVRLVIICPTTATSTSSQAHQFIHNTRKICIARLLRDLASSRTPQCHYHRCKRRTDFIRHFLKR